jgi:hypothetical protein
MTEGVEKPQTKARETKQARRDPRDTGEGETSKIVVQSTKSISERRAGKMLRAFIDQEDEFLTRHKDFPADVFEHMKVRMKQRMK